MADADAILQSTKQAINNLFSNVSSSANNASDGLRAAANSATNASYGLDSLRGHAVRASSALGTNLQTAAEEVQKTSLAFTAATVAAVGVASSLASMPPPPSGGGGGGGGSGGPGKDGGGPKSAIFKEIGRMFTDISGAIAGVGGAIAATGPAGAAAIGGLTVAVGTLNAAYGDHLEGINQLTASGIPFGRSLETYAIAVTQTTLDQQQFNRIMSQNSEALSVFGGGANAGAMRLVQLAGALTDTNRQYKNSGKSFALTMQELGVNAEEAIELQATMMNDTAMAENLRNMSIQDQATMTADYVTTLSQLEALTGKSKKQLADEQKRMAADAQFQATIYKMPAEQQQAMKDGLQKAMELGGPAAAEIFKARIAGVVPKSAEARQMLATPMGEMIGNIAGEMTTAGAAAKDVFMNNLGPLEDAIEKTRDAFAPLASAGVKVGMDLFSASFESTVKLDAIQESFAKVSGVVDKEAVNMKDAFDSFYATAFGIDVEKGTIGSAATQIASELQVVSRDIQAGVKEAGLQTLFAVDGPILKGIDSALNTLEIGERAEKMSEETIAEIEAGHTSNRQTARKIGELSTGLADAISNAGGSAVIYMAEAANKLGVITEEQLNGVQKEFEEGLGKLRVGYTSFMVGARDEQGRLASEVTPTATSDLAKEKSGVPSQQTGSEGSAAVAEAINNTGGAALQEAQTTNSLLKRLVDIWEKPARPQSKATPVFEAQTPSGPTGVQGETMDDMFSSAAG